MKIPIKKFIDDETKSFEERFKRLLAHHEEETKWMLAKLNELEAGLSAETTSKIRKWAEEWSAPLESNFPDYTRGYRHAAIDVLNSLRTGDDPSQINADFHIQDLKDR
jgi:hypothetical protein